MTIVCMHIHRDEADDLSLEYAARLARQTGQSLRAVCALPELSSVYAYNTPEFAIGVSTVMSQEIIAAQEKTVSESHAAFKKVVARVGLDEGEAEFIHTSGFPPQVAGEEALLADALVFPRAAAQSEHGLSGACEHVMMDRALPLVIAGTKARVEGPVIIAWDGSEQVARSVRFHLPMFRHLGRVIIAQNTKTLKGRSKGEGHTPEALQTWLRTKGLESGLSALTGHVGHGLLDLGKQVEAGLIVAGAYGHSRAGEYLFGGVTRTLLHAKAAPALALCH